MSWPTGWPGRWLGTTTLGVGVGVTLLSLHPVTLLAVGILSVAAAAAVAATVRPAEQLRARGATGRWAGIAVVASALTGSVGVLEAVGPSGLLLWGALLAAAWFLAGPTRPARRRVTLAGAAPDAAAPRPGRAAPSGSVGTTDEPVDVEDRLARLTDSELCWAWRNSYFAAQHAAADPGRLDRIARTRRGYLDEIQRRDPRAFAAWLDAGARAASNPARYWKSDA